MANYIKRSRTGKTLLFLRAAQIKPQKYAIETKLYNQEAYEININLPFFDTKEEAENYLSEHFEKEGGSMKKYDIMYACLGNGVTVCNRAITVNNDYPIIAHISEGGNVKYYENIPEEIKRKIDDHAAGIKQQFQEKFCTLPKLKQLEIILDNCSISKSLEYHGKFADHFDEIRQDYFSYC